MMTDEIFKDATRKMRLVVDEIIINSGDLSDAEIEDKLPEYLKIASSYSKSWYRRCHRTIDYEDIYSAGAEGAWNALRSFKHNAGSSERTWVTKGIWRTILGEVNKIFKHRQRFVPFGDTPILETAIGSDALDIYDLEEKTLAIRLVDIALERLSARDANILRKVFLEELPYADISSEEGISRQAISLRAQKVIERIRKILVEYPEFKDLDAKGILIAPEGPKLEHKYARLKIPGTNDFTWVNIAG